MNRNDYYERLKEPLKLRGITTAFSTIVLLWSSWSCNYSIEKKRGEQVPSGNDKGGSPTATQTNGSGDNLSFESVNNMLFKPHCVRCHNDANSGGGVNLESENKLRSSISSKTNQFVLVVGKPDQSAVYLSIINGSMPPRGMRRPSEDSVKLLSLWISALEPLKKSESEITLDPKNESKDEEIPPPPPTPTPTPAPTPTPPSSPTSDPAPTPNPIPPSPSPSPSSPPTPTSSRITFQTIVDKILVPHCVGCHGQEAPFADTNLALPYAELITQLTYRKEPLVTPGVPEKSWLYKSLLEGAEMRMPSEEGLPIEDINLVKTWILEGAKNQ